MCICVTFCVYVHVLLDDLCVYVYVHMLDNSCVYVYVHVLLIFTEIRNWSYRYLVVSQSLVIWKNVACAFYHCPISPAPCLIFNLLFIAVFFFSLSRLIPEHCYLVTQHRSLVYQKLLLLGTNSTLWAHLQMGKSYSGFGFVFFKSGFSV